MGFPRSGTSSGIAYSVDLGHGRSVALVDREGSVTGAISRSFTFFINEFPRGEIASAPEIAYGL